HAVLPSVARRPGHAGRAGRRLVRPQRPPRARHRARAHHARHSHRRIHSEELHAMCGIAGFVESASTSIPFSPDARTALAHRMCDVIRHRGPDDEGVWSDEGIALGMRRLSIIDLSTGHQPIHNEDRSIWIVFNGEIYNYQELRTTLEAA